MMNIGQAFILWFDSFKNYSYGHVRRSKQNTNQYAYGFVLQP